MPAPSPDVLAPPLSSDDHQHGPDGAPLVLLEFGDYACAFCTEVHPVVEGLREGLEGSLRFAYRHFPVASPRRSRPAARAAEAAADQGAFWEMHAALSEATGAHLDEDRLFTLAQTLGLDRDRFRQAFEADAGAERVEAGYESGRQSGVTGTPAFFLNGRRFQKQSDLDEHLADLGLSDDLKSTAREHLRRLQAPL